MSSENGDESGMASVGIESVESEASEGKWVRLARFEGRGDGIGAEPSSETRTKSSSEKGEDLRSEVTDIMEMRTE